MENRTTFPSWRLVTLVSKIRKLPPSLSLDLRGSLHPKIRVPSPRVTFCVSKFLQLSGWIQRSLQSVVKCPSSPWVLPLQLVLGYQTIQLQTRSILIVSRMESNPSLTESKSCRVLVSLWRISNLTTSSISCSSTDQPQRPGWRILVFTWRVSIPAGISPSSAS